MEHIPQACNIAGCSIEASYWIDTREGFTETLLPSLPVKDTFYLCVDHMCDIETPEGNEFEGFYTHLRIDTGILERIEIGKYCCDEECEICNQ